MFLLIPHRSDIDVFSRYALAKREESIVQLELHIQTYSDMYTQAVLWFFVETILIFNDALTLDTCG